MTLEEIKKIPKVELHVHLDGSVNIELASKLLNKNIDEVKQEMIAYNTNDLNEYLQKFELPISIMQTKENLTKISEALALQLLSDNVIYGEIRFAPSFHAKEGLSYDEIITSVLEGLNKVKEVKINLILCLMRGSSEEDNLKTLDVAYKYLNKGVVGIDLAGAEALYKNEEYTKLFEIAKEKNIPFTIHAGEASDYKSIESAINFDAKRIGHGINAIQDEKLLQKIKDEKIILEVCPTSNIQTKAVSTYNEHPIKELYEKGIMVTVNTDNRTVSNINLNKEYEILNKVFNFKKDDFKIMNKNAIYGAFLNNEEKEKFLNIINHS